jgi:uncharacterized membrane protein
MSRNRKPRRWRDQLPGRHPEAGFRWRGKEVSRLENLADAVFGFSVTLLVVAVEVPRDFMALRRVLFEFPAFVACFAILMLFWNAHYRFFRRYGFEDTFTQFANYVILLLELFAAYPLKFLFSSLFAGLFGFGEGEHGLRSLADLMFVFRTYGAGLALTWTMFALLYWHAYRHRARLELTPAETWLTRADLCSFVLYVGVFLLSIALTFVTDSPLLIGCTYMLIGPALTINYAWHGARIRAARAPAAAQFERLPYDEEQSGR